MMESESNEKTKEIGPIGHENDENEDEHFCIKCKMTIKGLENYIFHRKNECSIAIDRNKTRGKSCHASKIESESSTVHKLAATPSSNVTLSTCTATDALASEAAFMENIGLYLTPKPLLHNPRPPLTIPGLMSPKAQNAYMINEKGSTSVDNQSGNVYQGHSQWEEELVLEWPYNEHDELNSCDDNIHRTKDITSAPESKNLQRSQYSLLSYLPTKVKVTDSNVAEEESIVNSGETRKHNEIEIESITNQIQKEHESLSIPSQSEFMKQIELLNTNDKLSDIENRESIILPVTPSKLKLWNPERENATNTAFSVQTSEDIWNDVLESSVMESGEISYFDNVTNDPTLMEISVATNHTSSSVEGANSLIASKDLPQKSTPSKEESEYYCNECQRSLSDESAFERHLQSELHFKRSLKLESVTEDKRSRNIKAPTDDTKATKLKPSTFTSLGEPNPSDLSRVNSKYQICPTCHSTVERLKFGKHLVSHYHHHMSSLSGCKADNDTLIMNNIDKVVKECPFQCLMCNFFCNWEHDFSHHWQSAHQGELTEEEDRGDNKVYWCSLCQISASTCEEMSVHLAGTYHNDILSVINRCVPMIIKKISIEKCDYCNKTFRFRFGLREHVRKFHKMKDYQLENHNRYRCQYCTFATFSEKAFTAHLFLAHSEENSLMYKCRLCCVEFKTQIQMIRHRKTKEHKRKYKMKIEGCEKISCGFCDKTFAELKEAENHMWDTHQEQTSQCGFCGLRFAFPQELSAHIRLYCSEKHNTNDEGVKIGKRIMGSISCDESNGGIPRETNRKYCDFTCDNITMLYYHKMLKHSKHLHVKSIASDLNEKNISMSNDISYHETTNQQERLSCLVCTKNISRGKLWQHLSTHGDNEDISQRKCDHCFKVFPTIPHLLAHKRRTNHSISNNKRKKYHSKDNHLTNQTTQISGQPRTVHGNFERLFKCNFLGCDYATSKSSHLKAHQVVHDKSTKNRLSCSRCDTFTCKRKSELNRHMRARHPPENYRPDNSSITYERKAQEKFSCDKCSYSTSSRQHYSRHRLTHMAKSKQLYKCKSCTFSCATVENLRKHILKTNSHPGLKVYSCSQSCCNFSTDESNEYKNHLIAQHRNAFKSLQEIRTTIREHFLVKNLTET